MVSPVNLSAFEDVPVTNSFAGFFTTSFDNLPHILQIDSDGDGVIDQLFAQGEFSTIKEAIQALPDRAFIKNKKEGKENDNKQRANKERRKLIKHAKKVEKEIKKGHYKHALKNLRKLKKNVEKGLIDTKSVKGESSKADILHLIDSAQNTLEPLEENKRKKKKDEDDD